MDAVNQINQMIVTLETIKDIVVKTRDGKKEKNINYYELNYKANLLANTIDNLKELDEMFS